MVEIDIISGFLGAGKTTLIIKLLKEAYAGEKLALLENEFGEIAIDSSTIAEENIAIKELTNGCICCSLQTSFRAGVEELIERYSPERIIVEPTGIGKLSDIERIVADAELSGLPIRMNATITVVNATVLPALLSVAGDFFIDQIKEAKVIVLSAVQDLENTDHTLEEVQQSIRSPNRSAPLFAEDWSHLNSIELLATAEQVYAQQAVGNKDSSKQKQAALGQREHGHAGHEDAAHEHAAHEHTEHKHTEHRHENDGFESHTLLLPHAWKQADFDRFTNALSSGSFGEVFRAKGFVVIEGTRMKLDYVYGRWHVVASSPGETLLVIIGKGLDTKALESFIGRHNE